MSVHKMGNTYRVRFREDGRNKSLSFKTKREAEDFDKTLKSAREQAKQARRVREALERAQA